MATPDVQAALAAVHECGSVNAAAKMMGKSRASMRRLMEKAKRLAGETIPPAFEVEELPSELPTAEDLLKRRAEQFKRKSEAKEARKLVRVDVRESGPFGLAAGGDPHLDDDGTDIALVQTHVEIINRTPGLYGCNIGDYSNNWVGRLARLYGQQSVSAAESWVLVEWYIRAVNWMFLISGNHDCWSGDGDPIKWMARQARVSYEAHGMRLGLTMPNGRVIRINARHDFSGKSQWNVVHGVSKAAQSGWRDHVLMAGHTHQGGYQIVRDPATGLLSHCLRVSSYKTFDRYAEEKGLPNQSLSPCPVIVFQPDEPDDSVKLISVFQDTETGADFLTWLKRRKSGRGA